MAAETGSEDTAEKVEGASLKDRVTSAIARARDRSPALDHVIVTFQHYGKVGGSMQAGGVTYSAFLSFFPILALAFWAVGLLSKVYDGAEEDLIDAISGVLPDLVSLDGADGTIALSSIQDNAATVGWIGLAGVLFAGLSWLSSMRSALLLVFELPQADQPNFVVGKLRDLVTLALIGLVMVLSVGLSSVVSGFSRDILEWLSLGDELDWVLKVLTVVFGLLASTLLFFAMFRLLARPPTPARALWSGAFLGAVGFEVLKRLAGLLIASTKSQPAFQAFGIALVLLVWIYYFSRIVLYSASWAYTADPEVRAAARESDASESDSSESAESRAAGSSSAPTGDGAALAARVTEARSAGVPPAEPSTTRAESPTTQRAALAAGALGGAALAALVQRLRRD